jgi:hypothetical protein
MNLRQVKIIGVACMGMLIGCARTSNPPSEPSAPKLVDGNPHRVVTIASVTPGTSNPCEVDYPVTLLRMGKHHTISWKGSDHAYWVQFNSQSPIGPTTISVPNGSKTSDYPITVIFTDPHTTEVYFTYSIYDVDPNTTPTPTPCKKWDDDRDTGVNVKR